jgi:hypothetical protein
MRISRPGSLVTLRKWGAGEQYVFTRILLVPTKRVPSESYGSELPAGHSVLEPLAR